MTTKATKKTKTSPKAAAGKVPDLPDMQGEAGFESPAAKDIHVELPVPQEALAGRPSAKDEVIARLDRIIALLEGALTVERKGIDFESPAWSRFLKD